MPVKMPWTLKRIDEELSPRKAGREVAPEIELRKVLDTQFLEDIAKGEKDFSNISLKTERKDAKPNLTYADLRGLDLSGSDLDFSDMRMAKAGKTTRVSGASVRWSDARGVEGMEKMDGVESLKFYRTIVTENQKYAINSAILKSSGVTYDLSQLEAAKRDAKTYPHRFTIRAFPSEDVPQPREVVNKEKLLARG